MTLTSVVDLTGLDESQEAVISLVLLVSYLVTPLMSFSISAALTSIVSLTPPSELGKANLLIIG